MDGGKSKESLWGAEFVALTPVFFGVLRRLARQGYVHDAEQGMELIHDFFVEAWQRVVRTYDASRGSLGAYAATAFANFARPRLIREARWRETLTDEAGNDDIVEQPTPEPVDLSRVRAALLAVPPMDRALLLERFGEPAISERVLARRAGVSRYKIREQLAIALARLTALLGEAGALGQQDFQVARLLFQEGHSVRGVATLLRMTEPQVRAARRRVLSTFGRISGEAL